MRNTRDSPSRHWFQSQLNWMFVAFLAIAGFFLFTEHRAALGTLPFFLLLLCPLIRFFGHGGHGGWHGHGGTRSGERERWMTESAPADGLRVPVAPNSLVFIIFAFSFTKPRTSRDWRSFGAFSVFVVALFTEMYGFPLTIYFLSGWLQSRYPGIDWFAHDSGHLPEMLFGWRGNPHFGPFHLLSMVFIGGGFILLANAWKVLLAAQRTRTLATAGPYAHIRHPQYAAFVLVMFGFLLQWPTLLTVAMFPVLVFMYVRLARHEEREVARQFGREYERYAARTPAFIPRVERFAVRE